MIIDDLFEQNSGKKIHNQTEDRFDNEKETVRLPPAMTGRDPTKPSVDIPGTSYTVSMRGDDATTQQDARHLGRFIASVPNPLTKAAGMAMQYAGQPDFLPTGQKVARAMDSAGAPSVDRMLRKPVKEQGVAEGSQEQSYFYDFAELYNHPNEASHPDPIQALELVAGQYNDPRSVAIDIIKFAKAHPEELRDSAVKNAVYQLARSLKQGVAEGENNDTAISLSKLGKFHPGADSLAEFVPERATAQYALHPDKWESTFYSLTNKDSEKLKYYGPKKISIPPGTLVGDMAIANKFYRAKTPEEKQQYAELYKASLQPYPVDVSEYRMPELLIPRQGMAEAEGQQLSVNQLAMISDEALDNAYGYGRSSPGNTFGWQANLMSAAYAKKMIDAGVTDIEKISDAIHKGWNVTARKFVQDPDQFDDTEKLRQAGKLDAKLAQRAKLMRIGYFELDNDEQEKDRVVARALLQAIKGEQGVAEGGFDIPEIPRAQDPKLPKPVKENIAAGISKFYNNAYDSVTANLQRVALLAMQGRQDEAMGQLQAVIKTADPDTQQKIIAAVNNINPVMIQGRVATSSELDNSKPHRDYILQTFLPWVQGMLTRSQSLQESTVRDRLHKLHQEIRSQNKRPDPRYYKELGKSYDIEDDQKRLAAQKEIKQRHGVKEQRMTCPECGGAAYEDQMLAEKQDACYHKVKSRYKVWPSAYASGALVRCRKKGAANWGNKGK